MSHSQPGRDGRHGDADGRIERKRSDTTIGTSRETYGPNFTSGFRSDAKLSTVLEQTGHRTLNELLTVAKRGRDGVETALIDGTVCG